jgi:hypothetical protein
MEESISESGAKIGYNAIPRFLERFISDLALHSLLDLPAFMFQESKSGLQYQFSCIMLI